jgi:hypothetical protein
MSVREPQVERRRNQHRDTHASLCGLLDAARRDSGLAAVAVADMSGLLVAGSGAALLCEELAALAPVGVSEQRLAALGFRGDRPKVKVLSIGGDTVAISALGAASEHDYLRISDGCRRILSERTAGHSAAP